MKVCCIPSVACYLDRIFLLEKSQVTILGRCILGKAYLTYWRQTITASICSKLGLDIHWPVIGSYIDIIHSGSRLICHCLPVSHNDVLQWAGTTSGTLDNNKATIIWMNQLLSQFIQSNNLHSAQLNLRESLLLLQIPPDRYPHLPLDVKSHPAFLWSIAKLKSVCYSPLGSHPSSS